MIGSVFEHDPIKTTKFPRFADSSGFTDDTVLSVAIADAILNQRDLRQDSAIDHRIGQAAAARSIHSGCGSVSCGLRCFVLTVSEQNYEKRDNRQQAIRGDEISDAISSDGHG
jgi:hypothetical protein